MGAAARRGGGEQPTLQDAWSSMLAIGIIRAGRSWWAFSAISSLASFLEPSIAIFGYYSESQTLVCRNEDVLGFVRSGGGSMLWLLCLFRVVWLPRIWVSKEYTLETELHRKGTRRYTHRQTETVG